MDISGQEGIVMPVDSKEAVMKFLSKLYFTDHILLMEKLAEAGVDITLSDSKLLCDTAQYCKVIE